jgi:NAD-dependent SIR2 family protein deacetylase
MVHAATSRLLTANYRYHRARRAGTTKFQEIDVAVSPCNALSTRAMLATGIHAQPGAYAVLLGSGVSRAAGIPTGWEIVTDLVQMAAVATDPEDVESHEQAERDPEAWWVDHTQSELGYSTVLADIASSSAARQGLLSKYFVASDDELANDQKQPTVAHKAIAELVKTGWIKVVITTNFDRLMEEALSAAGVAYQVISRPEAVQGATPLAHATATVIKLHGDWADLEFRNTLDELDQYPEAWVDLLGRIFNEYGLVISGWSAEWDHALVRVLESTSRRYPLYWDSRSAKKQQAVNLLAQQGGHVIESGSADQLFTDLVASIDALQQLAEPPLTTVMAIARLKRALPDPRRRIELYDLIHDKTRQVIDGAALTRSAVADLNELDELLDDLLRVAKPLLSLLIAGVHFDDGTHTALWCQAIQWLLDARQFKQNDVVDKLQHYPALLALRTMGITAIRHGRDDVLIALLTRPRWKDPFSRVRFTSVAQVLHINHVLDHGLINDLPRWDGQRWLYPPSHLLKIVLEDVLMDPDINLDRYKALCADVEYRTGLVQYLLPPEPSQLRPNSGEYAAGDFGWDVDEVPSAENRFRNDTARNGANAWADILGERSLEEELLKFREIVKMYAKY